MKVFVGLSGGVDSAVSAALLKKAGHEVTGVFIRIALPGYPCSAGEDKIDAQRVAAQLRIPFIEIDLSQEYKETVFAEMVAEYARGRTPNPDALCNQKIKFGAFYAFSRAQGADCVATGHYARVAQGTLVAGLDRDKDQSYFLWMVPQEALAHTLFPVGALHKSKVRRLAEQFGLPNAQRKDSQGLCFLGDISVEDMLQKELSLEPGDVLNEDGRVVGVHRGAIRYTMGQRHGFELLEQTGVPHYVVGKNAEANTITVSSSPFPRGASKTLLTLRDTNWIGNVDEQGKYEARFRYRQKLIPVEYIQLGSKTQVALSEPQYAPLGQSLVLYQGERCIGGGIITDAEVS